MTKETDPQLSGASLESPPEGGVALQLPAEGFETSSTLGEETLPEPSIAEIVADRVRQHGDDLDDPWFNRWPGVGKLALLGTAAATVGLAKLGPVVGGIFGSVGASWAALEWAYLKDGRKDVHNRRYMEARMLQTSYGVAADIVRDNTSRELDLSWTPPNEPLSPDNLAQELRSLDEIARLGRIECITVPTSQIAPFTDELVLSRGRSQEEWLQERKGFTFKDGEQDSDLVTLNPNELQFIIRRIEIEEASKKTKEIEASQPIDTVMHILKHVQPDHRALRFHTVDRSGVPNRRLQRELRRAVQRHEELVTARLDVSEDGPPEGPTHQKVQVDHHLQVVPQKVINHSISLPGHRSEGSRDLVQRMRSLNRVGLPKGGLGEILKNWKKYAEHSPAVVAEACELAALLILDGQTIELPEIDLPFVAQEVSVETGDEVEKRRIVGDGLQERVRDRLSNPEDSDTGISFKPLRRRRSSRSLASMGFAAAAGLGILAGWTAVDKSSPDDTTGGHTETSRIAPADWGEWADENSGFDPPDASTVGNVPELQEETVFQIESFGGAETDGYWPFGISNSLISDPSENTLTWELLMGPGFFSGDEVRAIGSPDELNMSDSFIKVSGQLFVNSEELPHAFIGPDGTLCTSDMKDETCGTSGEEIVLLPTVPIRDGTTIIAATLNNQANVLTVGNKWGVQRLVMRLADIEDMNAASFHIEYALQTDNNPGVRMVAPLIYNHSQEEMASLSERVNQRWGEHAGESLPADSNERIDLEQSEVRSFDYALQPLPHWADLDDPEDIVDITLDTEAANCNTAGMTVAVDNPNTVNGAIGYLNNEENSTLSEDEAHFWLVDSRGQERDPTPPIRRQNDTALYLLIAAGLVVGSGTLRASRYLPEARTKVRRKYLEAQSPERLDRASQVILHALYAPAGSTFTAPPQHTKRSQVESLQVIRSVAQSHEYEKVNRTLRRRPGLFDYHVNRYDQAHRHARRVMNASR